MKIVTRKFLLGLTASLALMAGAGQAATVVGTYGIGTADGVVTSPPGGGGYGYISTLNGVAGAGQIAGVGGTNGSSWTSDGFSANAGDILSFNFNYVTSDGAGYADYAFAELLDASMTSLGYLFTARTTTSGNTSPGFGLPANISTLNPLGSPIVGGGPAWFALGGDSGKCYSLGCGYTGWINSQYTLAGAGTYYLRFGVTNWGDGAYQSGLAWNGAKIGDVVINPVPVPATLPLLAGLVGLGALARRRKS